MDPLSIIASMISIIGDITTKYKTIDNTANLPKAFEEVKRSLPIVEGIFFGMKERLRKRNLLDEQSQAILNGIKPCEDKIKELKSVIDVVKTEFEADQHAGEWARVRHAYYKALGRVKALGVESLMKDILKGLKKLAQVQVFELVTQDDLKAIENALEKLESVESSLEVSELDSTGNNYASQSVAANGTGHQYNTQGGAVFNGSNNINAPGGGSYHFNMGKA
ncbi:hypothetical protein BGZ61DRAFT_458395 [Ilyonectria robusta]|uniref:uncharacterized protein n=1 Tax=Ilyonectria robusta TaxID=1079257 RepID=UPI001E8D3567|nr:uncharacterized protein BGZ61DRAFT_458395 [Ilyonectria robusta]KAH8675147.1 hypothetical protein BGZ61DRAFT_458395 [Ilyonectria robusta]